MQADQEVNDFFLRRYVAFRAAACVIPQRLHGRHAIHAHHHRVRSGREQVVRAAGLVLHDVAQAAAIHVAMQARIGHQPRPELSDAMPVLAKE